MSDETTSETKPADETLPVADAAPPPELPPVTGAAPPEVEPKTQEQLLAERLEGGATSPTMPWGTGPRPENWVDPAPAASAEALPVVEHHFLVTDDGHRVEVDGKWYPVTAEQRAALEEAGRQGASTAEACRAVGVELAAE